MKLWECSKPIVGSINPEGISSVLDSANEESTSTIISRVGFTPNLKPCPQDSVHDILNIEDAMCSTHKDLLFSQSITIASESYQLTVAQSQTHPAVAEIQVSVEATIPNSGVAEVPDVSQYLHPN